MVMRTYQEFRCQGEMSRDTILSYISSKLMFSRIKYTGL